MTPHRLRILANLILTRRVQEDDPAAWASDLLVFAQQIELREIQEEVRIKRQMQAARDTARDAGYKLQLWDEDGLADKPIAEWIVGIDRDAEFNLVDRKQREDMAKWIWKSCADEDVRKAERAAERSLGDAWEGGFAPNH